MHRHSGRAREVGVIRNLLSFLAGRQQIPGSRAGKPARAPE
jgi:hypothetical protein